MTPRTPPPSQGKVRAAHSWRPCSQGRAWSACGADQRALSPLQGRGLSLSRFSWVGACVCQLHLPPSLFQMPSARCVPSAPPHPPILLPKGLEHLWTWAPSRESPDFSHRQEATSEVVGMERQCPRPGPSPGTTGAGSKGVLGVPRAQGPRVRQEPHGSFTVELRRPSNLLMSRTE